MKTCFLIKYLKAMRKKTNVVVMYVGCNLVKFLKIIKIVVYGHRRWHLHVIVVVGNRLHSKTARN